MVKSKILLKMSNYVLEEKVLEMFVGHLLLVLDYVLLDYFLKFIYWFYKEKLWE